MYVRSQMRHEFAYSPPSYSFILLFFIECYIFIKTKTDRYMPILYALSLAMARHDIGRSYCTHLCVMSLVFLFFLIDKYVFCNTADPTVPSIGSTVEDFNIAVSVMRLAFFLGASPRANLSILQR